MSGLLTYFSRCLDSPADNYKFHRLYNKFALNSAVNEHFTAVPREGEGTSILTALFGHIWFVWRLGDRLHSPGEKWTRDVSVLPRPVICFQGNVGIC